MTADAMRSARAELLSVIQGVSTLLGEIDDESPATFERYGYVSDSFDEIHVSLRAAYKAFQGAAGVVAEPAVAPHPERDRLALEMALEIAEAKVALGSAWTAGGASLAEGIRAKSRMLTDGHLALHAKACALHRRAQRAESATAAARREAIGQRRRAEWWRKEVKRLGWTPTQGAPVSVDVSEAEFPLSDADRFLTTLHDEVSVGHRHVGSPSQHHRRKEQEFLCAIDSIRAMKARLERVDADIAEARKLRDEALVTFRAREDAIERVQKTLHTMVMEREQVAEMLLEAGGEAIESGDSFVGGAKKALDRMHAEKWRLLAMAEASVSDAIVRAKSRVNRVFWTDLATGEPCEVVYGGALEDMYCAIVVCDFFRMLRDWTLRTENERLRREAAIAAALREEADHA